MVGLNIPLGQAGVEGKLSHVCVVFRVFCSANRKTHFPSETPRGLLFLASAPKETGGQSRKQVRSQWAAACLATFHVMSPLRPPNGLLFPGFSLLG